MLTKYKINPDSCETTIGYECPGCHVDMETLGKMKNIVGWTEIPKTLNRFVTAPALVYECPKCFRKIAMHMDIQSIEDSLMAKEEKMRV